MRGLKAVDLRDGSGNDNGHGIGHVVDLQRFGDRLLSGGTHQTNHTVCIYFFLIYGIIKEGGAVF